MWLWLPRRLNKRYLFVFQLVCFTFFIHCLLLLTYFFYSRPPIMTIKMQMSLVDFSRPITVVPFVKRTGQLAKLVEKKAGAKLNQNTGKNIEALKKDMINKKAAVLKQEKKPVRNIFKKESSVKKVVSPTKIEEKKEVKKEEIQPVVQKIQEVEPKIIPLALDEKKEESVVALPGEEMTSDEPIILGQEEFEALQIYQEVHAQLSRYWHPPAGLHPKKSTILLLKIGEKGEVLETEIEQSSGVLVYDIAARMAVEKAIFPDKLWNQWMRLHF